MAETKNELILAQDQHAFIQDETKGVVQVFAGPHKTGLTMSDRPVKYDPQARKFVQVPLEAAISQNPTVAEDSYVVLENPTKESGKFPKDGSNSPVELQIGRKINIPGPTTFALWPGQAAKVIEGHQLKTNEYLIVRVYNVTEAKLKWPEDALGNLEELEKTKTLVVGQELVIKGTDVSFFIPPTGIEVVPDPSGKFVRQAVTLEQLEYCILLDENGEKRYERGPKVVYPKATEKFIKKADNSATSLGEATEKTTGIKFKAIELNEQMGLYIKVIEDYTDESGVKHKVGDELFITGKEQKIYFPRPEHALIEYESIGENGKTFKRHRYYGITIPKGEARYVLNKDLGKIETIKGEVIFLPDPRNQVIVQRALDPKAVALWYPGNQEALDFNLGLQNLAEGSQNYVTANALAGASDLTRSINRTTSQNISAKSVGMIGDTLRRGTTFTPPPTITLNTKYDGTPVINVWTGYAVQVVDKSGNRRVVKGPATILLEYDETLEVLSLSTGKPKTTDNLIKDVYLRVDNNKVSDIVPVETKDMVTATIKVSYVANFEGDLSKAFNVENYVKFMCDRMRSMLRAAVKKMTIKDLMDNVSEVVRDTILGTKTVGKDKVTSDRPGLVFKENDLRVCDVEVLSFQIQDDQVSKMINTAQKQAVADALTLTAKQKELEIVSETLQIEARLAELRSKNVMARIQLDLEEEKAIQESELQKVSETNKVRQLEKQNALELEHLETQKAQETLARRKAQEDQTLAVEKQRTEMFRVRMDALNPKLVAAIQNLADSNQLNSLSNAVAPLAIIEQQGVASVLKRFLSDMPAAKRFEDMLVLGAEDSN